MSHARSDTMMLMTEPKKSENPTGFRFTPKQKAALAALAKKIDETKTDTVKIALAALAKKNGIDFPFSDM